jgi:STAS-like domain of unknown function (DUF4325)
MNLELNLAKDCGTFLAEGALAAAYRLQHIEPFYHAYAEIVLDFGGVRNINSSFANALIAPLLEQHGEDALKKLRFHGCNAVVRVLIEGALALGSERFAEHGKRELA